MSIRLHARTPLLSLWHDPSSPESVRVLQELHKRLSASSASKAAQTASDPSRSEAETYLELVARSKPGSEEPLAELQVVDRHLNPPTETQWQSIRSYLPAHMVTPSAFGQSAQDSSTLQGGAQTASSPTQAISMQQDPASEVPQRQTHPAVVGSAAAAPDASVRTRIRDARSYKAQPAVPLASESASPILSSGDKEPHASGPPDLSESPGTGVRRQDKAEGTARGEDTSALPVRLRPGPILVAWDDGVAAADWAGAKEILDRLERRGQSGSTGRGSSCIVA